MFLTAVAGKTPDQLSSFTKLAQTILYAVSLGGDCDTIASMAGAIAGAYYGDDDIPPAWVSQCEGAEAATDLADQLYSFLESVDR